jgi:hypothetical protein
MILDDPAMERRFASGRRVSEVLRSLAASVGGIAIADYAWEVSAEGGGVVRHLRRVTPVGLISLREEAPGSDGGAWSLLAQIVTLEQCADIAIVRKESADGDGFWELHVGDGNPRPVPDADQRAAFELVRAALEATRPR